MGKRTTQNELEIDEADVIQALFDAGWPLPDPAATPPVQVQVEPKGARLNFKWIDTQDNVQPGP